MHKKPFVVAIENGTENSPSPYENWDATGCLLIRETPFQADILCLKSAGITTDFIQNLGNLMDLINTKMVGITVTKFLDIEFALFSVKELDSTIPVYVKFTIPSHCELFNVIVPILPSAINECLLEELIDLFLMS